MKLLNERFSLQMGKGSPVFTWADSLCNDYRAKKTAPL